MKLFPPKSKFHFEISVGVAEISVGVAEISVGVAE